VTKNSKPELSEEALAHLADYHETAEAMPAIYLLGRIAIEWNYCEHLIGTLSWHYVGGIERGLAVITNLGNKSRADLLLALARQFEKDKEVIARIEFAAGTFNKLREGRNVLVHSHSLQPNEDGSLDWRRASTNPLNPHSSITTTVESMQQLLDTMAYLNRFCLELMLRHVMRQKRKPKGLWPPLPDIFPLPDTLPRSHPPAPKAKKRQRSSPGT